MTRRRPKWDDPGLAHPDYLTWDEAFGPANGAEPDEPDEPGGPGERPRQDRRPPRGPLWPQLGEAALHGLAGYVVEQTASTTEADPVGVLVSYLAWFGAAVGGGAWVMQANERQPAVIQALLVGDTAKARKGTALSVVKRIMVAAAPDFADRVQSGFGSGEALIDAVTGGDHRLLVVEPEFASVLARCRREGSTLSQIIRNAYDGAPLEVRSRQRTSVAREHHSGGIGHITREELIRTLDRTEIAAGFANRLLFALVRRASRLPTGGNMDYELVEHLRARTARALSEGASVGQVKRDPAAERRWAQLYDEMADDEPGSLLGAVVARPESNVTRLALVYALLDRSGSITVPALDAAWAVWCYCRASAEHIFGDSLGDPDADTLNGALLAAGPDGLSGTAMRDLFSRHGGWKPALDRLVEKGRAVVRPKTETGGRPGIVAVHRRYAT